jgi:hypothetical protein
MILAIIDTIIGAFILMVCLMVVLVVVGGFGFIFIYVLVKPALAIFLDNQQNLLYNMKS